ncbi:MAG: hypothetical protein KGH64_05320 [Candidatus Micrarchaeota archaeon]|nr:hypothetical protein [Candidatus Micrarchaeota archaeon]
MARNAVAEPRQVVELQTGRSYVAKSNVDGELGTGRVLAPLSTARTIQERDWYWISPESQKVSKDTYKGVPTETGYFRDNKDGTFTKVENRTDVAWEDRLYVSPEAAEKAARGQGPLGLYVRDDGFVGGRLYVNSHDRFGLAALVASVPRAQAGSVAAAPEVAKALRVDKDEMLQVTLPDGQTMQIDATAAMVVKRQ